MNNKFILIAAFFLASCSILDKGIDKDRIVTQKEEKLAIGEVTQTLNVSYAEVFPIIQKVFSDRKIPIKKADSSIGRIISAPVVVVDRKSSIPLNCEVTLRISAKPYKEKASKITVSYKEQCDDLEMHDFKSAESNAEKLMFSIVEDIKAETGVTN